MTNLADSITASPGRLPLIDNCGKDSAFRKGEGLTITSSEIGIWNIAWLLQFKLVISG